MAKIAINGFGRIGRNAFKIAMDRGLEVVAINDLTDSNTMAHLLKYDTCFGRFGGSVETLTDAIIVNGRKVKVFSEKNPNNLPWKELGIDIVIESTGIFRSREKAGMHLIAGAKQVIISATSDDEDIKTIILGVNDEDFDPINDDIIDNSSCTINCLAPVAKIIENNFGITKGIITTIHSYTNDQKLLDGQHEDLRRTRSAAESIIPTNTRLAKVIGKIIPALDGKIAGIAMRVPTPTVSLLDITFEVSRNTTVEEVNSILKQSADNKVLGFTDEPLVSVDFMKDSRSAIIDGLLTTVVGDNMIKIVAWYDNEWGYSSRLIDLTEYVSAKFFM